jgi:NMD protein affecting ribosome stability and mRNA decay
MSHHAKTMHLHSIGSPLRGPVFAEKEHDPYKDRQKPLEPALCPQCHAVFHNGRWQWRAAPASTHEETCPACRRTQQHLPAGFVTLRGEFFQQHRDELMALVNRHAEHAKAEHPLERIMATEDVDGGVRLTTTDTHLARGIGRALQNAYHGDLKFRYQPGQDLVRVHWTR